MTLTPLQTVCKKIKNKNQKEAVVVVVHAGCHSFQLLLVLPFVCELQGTNLKRSREALTGVQPSLSGELSGDGGSTTMLVTFTESSLHGSLR